MRRVMDLTRRLALRGGVMLLGLSVPAAAHNGALAIAVPVEGIRVDGDLSDWPEGMRRYAIALPEYGDKPKGPEDFQGNFRIGYTGQSAWGPNGYRYEWCIDIGRLSEGQEHLKPGTALAFDLALLDKDQDGSVSWIAWGPGIEKLRHSARLGWVSLVSGERESGDNSVLEVEQAETPPQIDGDTREWPEAQWHRFAPGAPQVSKAARNQPLNDGPTEPPGTAGTDADLSGSFALQWDDDQLYLAARVTDNVHDVRWGGTGRQMGLEDAVSLFLDIPSDGDGPAWISGDHAFTFLPDPAYPGNGKWWRYGDSDKQPASQEVPAPPETRLAVRPGAGGDYTIEAAIPMAALTKLTPAFHAPLAGRLVGFMFLVADPDGGANDWGGQLIYGGDNDDDANWMRLRFRPAGAAALQMGRIEGKMEIGTWQIPKVGISLMTTNKISR